MPAIQLSIIYLIFALLISPTLLAEAVPPAQKWCDDAALSYKVTKVKSDDVLFVRKGPGVKYERVGSIPPDGLNVKITGPATQVGKSHWVPIQYQQLKGWVNRAFLTADCFANGLYNIPVNNYQTLELTAFTELFNQAVALEAPWTQNPIQLSLQFLGDFKGHTQAISHVYDSIKNPTQAEILVIRDGLLNDAVRGERYRLRLEKITRSVTRPDGEDPLEQTFWQLNSAEHTWRCWAHRGHTEFTAEPCQ